VAARGGVEEVGATTAQDQPHGGRGDADCRARGCRSWGMEEEDWREERLREASAAQRGGIGSRVRTRKDGLYTLPIWRDAKGSLVE